LSVKTLFPLCVGTNFFDTSASLYSVAEPEALIVDNKNKAYMQNMALDRIALYYNEDISNNRPPVFWVSSRKSENTVLTIWENTVLTIWENTVLTIWENTVLTIWENTVLAIWENTVLTIWENTVLTILPNGLPALTTKERSLRSLIPKRDNCGPYSFHFRLSRGSVTSRYSHSTVLRVSQFFIITSYLSNTHLI
jgi:hypothetical protein